MQTGAFSSTLQDFRKLRVEVLGGILVVFTPITSCKSTHASCPEVNKKFGCISVKQIGKYDCFLLMCKLLHVCLVLPSIKQIFKCLYQHQKRQSIKNLLTKCESRDNTTVESENCLCTVLHHLQLAEKSADNQINTTGLNIWPFFFKSTNLNMYQIFTLLLRLKTAKTEQNLAQFWSF